MRTRLHLPPPDPIKKDERNKITKKMLFYFVYSTIRQLQAFGDCILPIPNVIYYKDFIIPPASFTINEKVNLFYARDTLLRSNIFTLIKDTDATPSLMELDLTKLDQAWLTCFKLRIKTKDFGQDGEIESALSEFLEKIQPQIMKFSLQEIQQYHQEISHHVSYRSFLTLNLTSLAKIYAKYNQQNNKPGDTSYSKEIFIDLYGDASDDFYTRPVLTLLKRRLHDFEPISITQAAEKTTVQGTLSKDPNAFFYTTQPVQTAAHVFLSTFLSRGS